MEGLSQLERLATQVIKRGNNVLDASRDGTFRVFRRGFRFVQVVLGQDGDPPRGIKGDFEIPMPCPFVNFLGDMVGADGAGSEGGVELVLHVK